MREHGQPRRTSPPSKDARERREEARRALAAGIDHAAQRKVERASLENTFHTVALEWLGKQQFATATREKAEWTFRDLLFLRIDVDVLAWFEQQVNAAGGGSYQSLIHTTLREQMKHKVEPLEATLRRVLRGELRTAG